MTETQPIKVAITDDHKIVRDGIKALLIGISDISVVGEAPDAETMLSKIKGLEPDVLLLDLMMPGMDGITMAEKLRERMPGLKILVLTSNTDEVTIIRALHAGVKGYVSKEASGEELIRAIRCVAAGDEYFGERIASVIFRSYLNKASQVTGKEEIMLTAREKEVIACFGDGLSYKETAARLSLSPRTVETHRNTIMEKLGLHSLAELIKFAIRAGIVKL
ncbi:MAG TPA: response regulator transcription factor [Bacteroidales bacterium]|jgi:DNA-binding NarL/FixJ family response regulator|nr:response regulator transcription factor [Bacteroidales bacterium]